LLPFCHFDAVGVNLIGAGFEFDAADVLLGDGVEADVEVDVDVVGVGVAAVVVVEVA
jgi:hypothetical protein